MITYLASCEGTRKIMRGKCLLLIIPQVFLFTIAETARILAVLPTPSISHQVVFRPLTHELARRGHEVIIITPDPVYPAGKAPANLTEIDFHDISYDNWKSLLGNHNGNADDLMHQVKQFFRVFASTIDLQLETPEFKEILKKGRDYFDLMILESCNRPVLGLTTIFDAPIIQISSFGIAAFQFNDFGAPMHPILYPGPAKQRLYNLSLLDKAVELFKYVAFEYLVWVTESYDYSVMQKHFGEDVPSFFELKQNVQMIFINEHPIWADNRPVPPNIIFMGGIHQPANKELPKDLQEYLDSSKEGVIYVSFGTNVMTTLLPQDIIQMMVKVFSELPYNVLWKIDSDMLPNQSKNIRTSKWFPQSDLLKHPNVKLFITQGGLQSTDETIDAAVPVIGIPMLGDQWYNVEKYVRHNIGLKLDLQSLTEHEFKTSIETVINDQSYKKSVIKLRTLMRQYAVKPLDLTVWWAEHIIKYGGKHLRPPAAFINWLDYYEYKIVSAVFVSLATVVITVIIITRRIVTYLSSTLNNVKVKRL